MQNLRSTNTIMVGLYTLGFTLYIESFLQPSRHSAHFPHWTENYSVIRQLSIPWLGRWNLEASNFGHMNLYQIINIESLFYWLF